MKSSRHLSTILVVDDDAGQASALKDFPFEPSHPAHYGLKSYF